MLKKNELRSIIDLVNIDLKILNKNLITNLQDLENFKIINSGLPILIPALRSVFEFDHNDVFFVKPKIISKHIYRNKFDHSYRGLNNSFPYFKFLKTLKLKDVHIEMYNYIKNFNLNSIQKIKNLKKSNLNLGSFQTRNIPHLGHELIIKKFLEKCDHVVINPLLGPKKEGDFQLENFNDVISSYFLKKYKNKVSFIPYYANMYYAGPYEAIHHCIMRKKIGFNFFTVGRDHAGMDNFYNPWHSVKLLNKLSSRLDINLFLHEGSFYCNLCKNIVLKDHCHHSNDNLQNISGTMFRKHLQNNTIYNLADKNLQLKIQNKVG